MKKLLKAGAFIALFALATVNQSNAAFPTEKATTTVSSLIATKTATATTKKEAKKEIATLAKANAKSSAGKSKIAAALLAFFLGGFGVHSFYMGQTTKGLVQLGLTVLGIGLTVAGLASFVSGAGQAIPATALIGYLIIVGVGLWAFIDFIRILTGGLEPEEGFDS